MPRTVTAPHVDALVFGIEQGPAVSYSDDAPPIDHEEPGFRVALKDQTVRFELKEHYATKDEALERVGPYVRNWEMDAGLDGRPGDFRLQFQYAEAIDRDPPPPPPSEPGIVNIAAFGIAGVGRVGRASLSVVKPSYPSPPSGLTLKTDDPDVATMYHRLSGYYSNREPLPSMAYFCLTVLELPFLGSRNVRRTTGAHYYIDKKVLDEIGELSSKKGGPPQHARLRPRAPRSRARKSASSKRPSSRSSAGPPRWPKALAQPFRPSRLRIFPTAPDWAGTPAARLISPDSQSVAPRPD